MLRWDAAVADLEGQFRRLVGVPAITPLEGVNDRPGGNEPAVIDQVSGGVPPLAVNVAE